MANDMANQSDVVANDRCPDCGGLYALLGGKIHRCSGSRGLVLPPKVPVIAPSGARCRDAQGNDDPREASTYRFRDPEKRRAYQREFMRQWRAAQKVKHGQA